MPIGDKPTERWIARTKTTRCSGEHPNVPTPARFRREFPALPIWEQPSLREIPLREPHRWQTSPHVPPQNDAPHRPANVPQPKTASPSDKSGKFIQEEDQYAA